jgi:hypothetical protein
MANQPRRRRQVTFPPIQAHVKTFEYAFIALWILCIIVVVVIAKATDWGVTTRP